MLSTSRCDSSSSSVYYIRKQYVNGGHYVSPGIECVVYCLINLVLLLLLLLLFRLIGLGVFGVREWVFESLYPV
jgi:hypothetical protein